MEPVIRYTLGAWTCLAVLDGTANYSTRAFFANAPEEALAGALAAYGITDGVMRTPFYCLVVQTGAETVLIDTGLGSHGGPDTGHLRQRLLDAGIGPEDVDVLILSHGHLDHIGGAVDEHGAPAFPRARVVLTAVEWEYWQSETALDGPSARNVPAVRAILNALRPYLDLVEPGAVIVDGIRLIDAPGHTPGQAVIQIGSGTGPTLRYIADVIAHPLHAAYPAWNIGGDVNRAQAVEAREEHLMSAVNDGVLLYVYHLSPPGFYGIKLSQPGWRLDLLQAGSTGGSHGRTAGAGG